MAKADDASSTRWMPWGEAVERAGSVEALLAHLRKVRILMAQHQGLYYRSSGKVRSGPGKVDPDWWANADVDPVTGEVIFTVEASPYHIHFVGEDTAPPAAAPIMAGVFAFGIELGRTAIETRWPTKPGPERVELRGAAVWIVPELERMKKAKEIPPDIGITDLSLDLAERMVEARVHDKSIRPIKARSIENALRVWSLFPVK